VYNRLVTRREFTDLYDAYWSFLRLIVRIVKENFVKIVVWKRQQASQYNITYSY